MKIPLVDLSIQHQAVEAEVRDGIAGVIAEGAFVLGPQVAEFEAEFAAYCEVEHCVGVANGTDALEMILRARGIGPRTLSRLSPWLSVEPNREARCAVH